MEEYFVVLCPHCENSIQIYKNEINCAIFRHGVFINNGQQINPHCSKDKCEKYVNQNLIYGCGKPFKIINDNNNYKAIICDYI